MTPRTRSALIGVGIFFAGAGVALGAAYLVALPVVRLFGTAPLYRAASEGKLDVSLLRKLRSGDTNGPIKSLELLLDGNIVTLGTYAKEGDHELRSEAVSALSDLARYRRDFPTTQTDPQMLQMVNEALSNANISSEQVP